MTSERINPADLARPSGFSHAVSVGGGAAAGRMVFLAGQTGVERDGNVADGGVVPQFERAMTNLLTALGAAGGMPSDLVSLTMYLTDVPDYQAHAREIGAVWRRLAGTEYPAMAAGSPKARWSARNRSAYASSSSRRSVSAVVSCGWAGTIHTPGATMPKPSLVSSDRSTCRRCRSDSGTEKTASTHPAAGVARPRRQIRA